MTHYISNSGKDERGKLSGGQAGDQTGKEWQLRSWYSRPWTCVLRHPDKGVREKIAELGKKAAKNDKVGYDQNQRGTYWTQLQKAGYDPSKIDTPCEADCSQGVISNTRAVGYLLDLDALKNLKATYTGNMRSAYKDAGFKVLTEKKYLDSPDYLLPGDILLYDNHHTATNISLGAKAVEENVTVYPDISHHHPVSDWKKIKESAPFLIMKATQGMTFVDPMLDSVINECENQKIPYWLYAFLDRGNELEQTKRLVDVCKDKVGTWFRGYCIDVERANEAANVALALAWLANRGERCMIYTGYKDYGLYKAVLDDRAENVCWWEARYGKNNGTYSYVYPPHDGVDLHQFTDNGYCPGVKDRIDLNRLTITKPQSWFTEKIKNSQKYTGEYPALPERGYYTLNDGMKVLTTTADRAEIKKVQKLVNWINNGNIEVDGKYGKNTAAAVKLAQTNLKVYPDGEFGKKTLAAAKKYTK